MEKTRLTFVKALNVIEYDNADEIVSREAHKWYYNSLTMTFSQVFAAIILA